MIGVFVVGALFAIGYVWLRRVLWRRLGQNETKLTPVGNFFLVVFSVVLGVAVTMRQLFPETAFGEWLTTEGKMTTFVVGCLAVLFVVEAFLKWLGYSTSKSRSERDV
jgi:Kef-type K+ transport system membrane component KefB